MGPQTLREQNGASPRPGDGAALEGDSFISGRHLLDYVRVLYKRRWTALPIFAIVAGTVIGSAFTAVPIYEARTQLLIEVENPNVITFKEVLEQERATMDYYETQYRMLRSRTLAKKTLDALKLWNHPEFTGATRQGFSVNGVVNSVMSSATSMFSKLLSSPPEPARTVAEPRGADETLEESIRIDAFLARLSVEPVRNSRLVDVKFRSTRPELAAAAANGVAKAYMDLLQEFRFEASRQASDWLGQRLQEQDKNVETAELRLQQYREQNGTVNDGRSNIVAQKLADLSAAVTRAKTERISKEILYNQVKAIQQDQKALDTFPAILGNTYIQQLKAELTRLQQQEAQLSERLADRHPDMLKVRSAIETTKTKIDAESAKVVQAIENDYLAAKAQEANLASAVEAQKRELLDQERRAIKFEALQRDAATDRQIFEGLLQRAKETNISGELKTTNIRVVDVADRPRVPVEPRKARSLLIGLFGGGFLAIGLSFFAEYLDKRVKSPDEMKALGLPFLGLMPAIPAARAAKAEDALATMITSPHFEEALKGLRTKLLVASSRQPGARSIVVTSTGPNEGKTLIAAHLAVALAEASRQVLLIDADMRQPSAHQQVGVRRTPGLSNVIAGTASVSDAVCRSSIRNLWVLPAGDRPQNAAELLEAERFARLLKLAAERFDWIVIDSPPVLAVTDPCVLAPLVDGVLFVVGSEMTTKQSVQTALEELEAVNARFVGGLLNRVNIYRNRYYYSDYYKREYGQYYEQAV